jgi:elongation factor P
MALSITNLKKGVVFQWEGEPFRVVEYNQKVMGRGGSIVNVRIKSLVDGKVLEKTFKGNEQLESADVTTQAVQYLYSDGSTFYFMVLAILRKVTRSNCNSLMIAPSTSNCPKMCRY